VLVAASGDVPGLAFAGLLDRRGLDAGALADPGGAVPGGALWVEPPGLLDHLHHPGRTEQGVGVGHGVQQAARAGPDQAALLGLVPEAVRRLRRQVEGAAGIPHPLHQLDGGLAAPGDGAELVKDQGGVLPSPGLAEGGVVGEVLQQQPHGRIRVLAAGQVRRAEVGEVDILERPASLGGVEAAGGGGEEVGEPPDGPLDGSGLVAADQALGFAAPVGVVLVQPHEQLGVHASHQLTGAADEAVLAGAFRARRSRREATSW
jgi:hypothetical protein